MDNLITTLSCKQTGYMHWKVSVVKNGKTLRAMTMNGAAVEAAFDDGFGDGVSIFETKRQAQEELVKEILKANS